MKELFSKTKTSGHVINLDLAFSFDTTNSIFHINQFIWFTMSSQGAFMTLSSI